MAAFLFSLWHNACFFLLLPFLLYNIFSAALISSVITCLMVISKPMPVIDTFFPSQILNLQTFLPGCPHASLSHPCMFSQNNASFCLTVVIPYCECFVQFHTPYFLYFFLYVLYSFQSSISFFCLHKKSDFFPITCCFLIETDSS